MPALVTSTSTATYRSTDVRTSRATCSSAITVERATGRGPTVAVTLPLAPDVNADP